MNDEEKTSGPKLSGFDRLLFAGFAVLIAGLILGSKWLTAEEPWSPSNNLEVVGLGAAMAVIFASGWVEKLSIWARMPQVVQDKRGDVVIFAAAAVMVSVLTVEDGMSLGQTLWTIAFEFLLMFALLCAVVFGWHGLRRWWIGLRKP